MPTTAASAPWLDRSAAALSGLCLVHCALAATLIVADTPLAWLGAHRIHTWGLAMVAPLSLVALL
ncbi:MAG: MerC family mercury resistance protein, partial [Sphingomonadaceae bacterium]